MIYLLLYLAKDIRCYLNLWYIFFFSSTSFNFCFCVNFSFFRPCYPGFLSHLCYICFIDTSFVVFILFISLYPIYLLDTLFLSSIKTQKPFFAPAMSPWSACPLKVKNSCLFSLCLYLLSVFKNCVNSFCSFIILSSFWAKAP